jgi:predicted PurR-regulated permease PerM
MCLIIGGGIYLFSTQIIQLSENFTEFKDKIIGLFADVTLYINKNISFAPHLEKGELFEKLKTFLNNSVGTLVNQTFNGTVAFLTGLLSAIVFTFLILLYRDDLVHAFVSFYSEKNRKKAFEMFKSVQKVGQHYLFGMVLIILILGILNSIGLWIIGIDSPFLFGFLAAVLAIIPYAGTAAGAAIPVLYALMTFDSIWMPIAIVIFFWLVQFIEGNYLTPKIVGGNLKVNALTAILSIIVGASVWGVAGMILFLPFTAMLKVICQEYEDLKPIALLIGNFNDKKRLEGKEIIAKTYQKIKVKLTK